MSGLDNLDKKSKRITKLRLFSYVETFIAENPGEKPTVEEMSVVLETSVEETREYMYNLFFEMYQEL